MATDITEWKKGSPTVARQSLREDMGRQGAASSVAIDSPRLVERKDGFLANGGGTMTTKLIPKADEPCTCSPG